MQHKDISHWQWLQAYLRSKFLLVDEV